MPTSSPRELRFSAEWAIRTEELEAFLESYRAGRIAGQATDAAAEYVVEDGVALLELAGVMTKSGYDVEGVFVPGTTAIRVALSAVAADPAVRGILLRIDSPGGLVAGSGDLAGDLGRAAAGKPVVAFIEDLGASAAYRVAARASRIVANSDALVGSIGTYTVIRDWSRYFENAGITTHVVRAGAMKGVGAIGAEVTDEQLAEVKRTLDEINARLLEDVAEGRGLPLARVRELADGAVHIAGRAKELGLVDRVGGFADAMAELEALMGKRSRPAPAARKELSMSAETKAATITELKAACPGAESDFLCAQLEAGATVEAATRAWTSELSKRLDAERAARAEAEKRAEEAAAADAEGAEGVGEGLTSKGGDTGTAIERFDAAVRERTERGMDRAKACVAVAKADPDLHRAYLVATNPGRRNQRLIDEKFE